jgi:Co/Zn/Cd efflux system component
VFNPVSQKPKAVQWSGTQWPDIAVTVIIAYLGMSSALRVIRLATRELQQAPALMRMPAE